MRLVPSAHKGRYQFHCPPPPIFSTFFSSQLTRPPLTTYIVSLNVGRSLRSGYFGLRPQSLNPLNLLPTAFHCTIHCTKRLPHPKKPSQSRNANIVGYLNKQYRDASDKPMKYVPFGACFSGVGKEGFSLSDIQLNDNTADDVVQILDSSRASAVETYFYLNKEMADGDDSLVGWWLWDMSEKIDAKTVYGIGTGFLGCFRSGDVKINYAGQVPPSGVSLDCSGKTYVVIPNIAPRKAKLGEFVIVNGTGDDNFQILDPERASASDTFIFFNKEMAEDDEELLGWWKFDMSEKADDVDVEPGAAFLGKFGGGHALVVFPQPIK